MNLPKYIKIIGIICLLLLVAAISLYSINRDKKSSDRAPGTHLIVATDLHYLASELTDQGEYFQNMLADGDGKITQYVTEITDAFLEQVIDQHPDALILSGDLTFNGAKSSHIELADKLQKVADSGVAVLALPGNHDLYSRMAASFSEDTFVYVENIDAETFEKIYSNFGYSDSLSSDKASLSYIYKINEKVRILMVDVNTKKAPGKITNDTLEWIEGELIKANQEGALVIGVSHQTLLAHSKLFSYGFIMNSSAKLRELYEKFGVLFNLSGHMHIQHIATSEAGLPEIVTSALSITPNQYGVIHLNDKVVEYHTEKTDVSEIQFPDSKELYPYHYFWQSAYDKAYEQMKDNPQASSLSQYFADVNTAYFTGNLDTIDWEDPRYEQWKAQDSFISTYFESISKESQVNMNTFSFALPQLDK
jgi:Icc-related predicted phosphoesterase